MHTQHTFYGPEITKVQRDFLYKKQPFKKTDVNSALLLLKRTSPDTDGNIEVFSFSRMLKFKN